ncbi:hypothetical protein [Nostoc sp. DedQUE09]|uniref:hypothetical protein n=1 Tax=Nostoc sp. DedQUE09 TaxID=3075394 RepID=UPI002AD3AC75|nr:hypothetical protein [Nostoc sp. DedQUE09]MDZ7956271.1 hypothetical protein [Nostoc sp. DedQUE09]
MTQRSLLNWLQMHRSGQNGWFDLFIWHRIKIADVYTLNEALGRKLPLSEKVPFDWHYRLRDAKNSTSQTVMLG